MKRRGVDRIMTNSCSLSVHKLRKATSRDELKFMIRYENESSIYIGYIQLSRKMRRWYWS